MTSLKGLLLVALAALSWGTTGTTLKLIGADGATAALLVGAIRMLVAAPALVAVALIREGPLRISGRGFVLAGLCMAAYQVCYFSAVPLAGVAATALLAICSAPIMIALLAYVLIGEALTLRRLLALGLGICGAGLLLAGTGVGLGQGFGLGGLLALGAGFAYSLYAVTTKRSLAGTPPLGLSALTFSVAALALLPLVAARRSEALELAARGTSQLLYLGLVATAAAYWLYAAALRSIPAGAAAVAGLLEPLTATLLGVILFRERLGPAGFAGAALLLAAVLLLGLAGKGEPARASAGRIRACSR
ncbi:MAG TPA: EamA family transporter [Chloroflexota bacterium]|nr:EamA family transporter [Chloroflexota bacterium]